MINEYRHESLDGLKRIEIFPEKFTKPKFGTVYNDRFVTVDDRTRSTLKYAHGDGVTIYDAEEKYAYLKPMDVIGVDKSQDGEGKKILVKITNVRIVMGKELLDTCADNPTMKHQIESQISRQIKLADNIRVLEATVTYDWQIEQDRPVV